MTPERSTAQPVEQAAHPEPKPVAANYRYWQEHGGTWAAEYDARKRDQVYYHIQEIMLTEYVRQHAPARVLELGCGPGRHLRNLARLPGIQVHGFDQSPTMVAGCLTWTDQAWLDSHVTLGSPTGRLPFADDEFDIVYTAEVLVHVRPEDLPGRLAEMLRVARRQVFHLETSPDYQLVSNEHDGCWYHDLCGAYERLGRRCERLPAGYVAHSPYRVIVDAAAPAWEWSPVVLDLLRRMEGDLSSTINSLRASPEQQVREQLGALAAAVESMEASLKEARERQAHAEAQAAQAHERAQVATARAEAALDRSAAESRRAEESLQAAHNARAAAASAHESAHGERQAREHLAAAVTLLESQLGEARQRQRDLAEQLERAARNERRIVREIELRVGRS